MGKVRIAVGPEQPDWAIDAVRRGGAEVCGLDDDEATGLVWVDVRDPKGLRQALETLANVAWVQLISAGVEAFVAAGVLDEERTWACAKGANADPVAEHALTLTLSCLRAIPVRARATSWGKELGTSLYGAKVTILGGGGIARSLLGLLAPFGVESTVVRRSGKPTKGASHTVSSEHLHDALADALVVVVALSLTDETRGIIGAPELAVMASNSVLVNIARGPHVVTDALVDALETGSIAWAGLDVTDPEPLPDGHRLWSLPNALVTPHSANPSAMSRPLLADRIAENTAHFIRDEALVGVVDVKAGY